MGLIVGVVIGSVAFLVIVGGAIAIVIYFKGKGSGSAGQPVNRTLANDPEMNENRGRPRLQTRNPRAVKLPPITVQTFQVPLANAGPKPTGNKLGMPIASGVHQSSANYELPSKSNPSQLSSLRYYSALFSS